MSTESIETTVARLDERFRGFQAAFAQMADDQRRMAESYEKLVESNQRVALLEADLVAVKIQFGKLADKLDSIERAHVASEQRRTEEALKTSHHWMGELVRTGLTVAASVILYHFGVHVL